ncbi:MAG: hypothetical protein AB8B80_12085, partial [Marinicellaceae bacterium]
MVNSNESIVNTTRELLKNIPKSWVELTTHRLDIYNEPQAKSEFIVELQKLILSNDISQKSLKSLPTAYDYIRLGHQLSSLLEWVLAEINNVNEDQIITFASKTMPILAILRKNALIKESTHIYYDGNKLPLIDEERLKDIYGYHYQIHKINHPSEIHNHSDGVSVLVTHSDFRSDLNTNTHCDITVNIHPTYGSAMVIHNSKITNIISDVQHVRRRETIAMSPINSLKLLKEIVSIANDNDAISDSTLDKMSVFKCIQENTGSNQKPLIASSGLSIQYAIMMGFIENAVIEHPTKPIKIILPPNCYGGTNDQSRRIADLIPNVGIVDLLVDGGQDLVNSLDEALKSVALIDGVPIVLAEIPTNPRVEVPDMVKLGEVLTEKRLTQNNELAVEPFFMVDQTFCPNVKLLNQDSELRDVKTISFSSGSKFPSGGRCIAGYCAANNAAQDLLSIISSHLILSDNQANEDQLKTLAENMPSMPVRIVQAYKKTREFVNFIQDLLPESKMFYINDDIAEQGFMPSVFSLDLPTQGDNTQQRNERQIQLNENLIKFMIEKHPNECKNCVSYGQLKGSYWTIPATSTQGTTKEEDKDYVVRVALSPDVDVSQLS